MNICVQYLFDTFLSVYLDNIQEQRSYAILFNFFRNHHTVFPGDYMTFHSHWQYTKASATHTASVLVITATLMDRKY
jgi:hypothetical protein